MGRVNRCGGTQGFVRGYGGANCITEYSITPRAEPVKNVREISDMADGTEDKKTEQEAQTGTTPAAALNTEPEPDKVPYARFKEKVDEAAELKRKWAEHVKAQAQAAKDAQEAEAKRLAEQGEHQKRAELAEARVKELEPYQEQNKEYETVIANLLDAKLKTLTPEAKAAVESLPEGMSTLAKLNWITTNEGLFTRPVPPNVNATSGASGKPEPDSKEREAQLRKQYRI